MTNDKWVITGVNALTGERQELSHPMEREAAEARLQREKDNRRYQRYAAHTRLRIEKVLPTQLAIKFGEYE